MSPKDLDKLFKNALDSQDPAIFDPAHWEGASRLLAADKAKKRRDRLLFLLFILIMGMFNIGLIYRSSTNTFKEVDIAVPPDTYKRAMAGISEKSETLDSVLRNKNESLVVDETHAFTPSKGTENNLESFANTTSVFTPSASTSRLLNNQTSEKKDPNSVKAQQDFAADPDIRIIEKQFPVLDYLEEKRSKQLEVNSIASRSPELDIPPLEVHPDLPGALFRKRSRPPNRFGWTAGLLLQPGKQGSAPVQGMELGIAAEYFFKQKWFAGIAPQLQWRINQKGFSKFQELTTFSFSSVHQTFGLKANSLQVINIPIYIGWNHKKNILEGGATFNWLVAARGQLQQIDIDDGKIFSLSKFENGWIATDAMKKLTTSLFVSYKFQINSRMYTGFNLQYQLDPWYPGLPNQLDQTANRRLTFGWQGIYYIQ